ncbi:maleylpyruvate isomerase family mycothiol-dependent enzyme [Streptomyces sp. ISL-11]|nr:maleylpyruvate isomerase family mycothiol-dependent enzyme [Streptomyces sp. ISL-11]
MRGLEHHCVEIIAQTDLLREQVKGVDPVTTPVPSCPGWNLGQLLRHVGGTHRWAETVVRTRTTGPLPHTQVDDLPFLAQEDPDELGSWLAEGAVRLAGTLRAAGPRARVWTVAPGGTPAFWARRMAHETAVHRADAASATGAEYTLAVDAATDAVDEWMGFSALPQAFESQKKMRELLGPGRGLSVRATDAAAGWLVDLGGDAVVCRRADGEEVTGATATVRGPLTALLLLLYRRPPVPGAEAVVSGDVRLFDSWVERAGFWLRR